MAVRNLFWWFLTAKGKAAAEAESRRWIAECPNCHAKTSIWDLGGMRYHASGNNSWAGYPCKQCGKWGMHKVTWSQVDPRAAGENLGA
jgi:hypothetical protein